MASWSIVHSMSKRRLVILRYAALGPGRPRRACLKMWSWRTVRSTEVARNVVPLQDGLDVKIDIGGAPQSRSWSGEPLTQLGELFVGRRHVPLPPGLLAQGEQRAPHPDHRPTL